MPEKKKSSCAQLVEWPFELGFTEQIPKILEDNSKHFRPVFEKHFSEANEPKKPRNIFQSEKFRTIFEKRTPIYSLAAPLLGLAKSIYYIY